MKKSYLNLVRKFVIFSLLMGGLVFALSAPAVTQNSSAARDCRTCPSDADDPNFDTCWASCVTGGSGGGGIDHPDPTVEVCTYACIPYTDICIKISCYNPDNPGPL